MNAHAFPFSPRQVAAALGGEVSGDQVLAPAPGHSPKDRSLSIKIGAHLPGGFIVNCFSGAGDPLALKDYVREKMGVRWEPSQQTSAEDIINRMNERARANKQEGKSDPPTAYVYFNADGSPRLRVNRTQNRNPPFWQEHWNGAEWSKGGGDQPRVPYRLPDLLAAQHDDVLIVEGEKDADNVAALGLVATTNAGGSGNWHTDLNQYFKGKNIFILPDNDEPGEKHAQKVHENLKGIAREIKILRLPGLPEKGDVSDWIAAGGTLDGIVALLRAAPRYEEEAAPETEEAPPGEERASVKYELLHEMADPNTPRDWITKGIFARGETSMWYAPPGQLKSALLASTAVAVASGSDWGTQE